MTPPFVESDLGLHCLILSHKILGLYELIMFIYTIKEQFLILRKIIY